MNIAVIGAGNWGKNIVRNLHHLGHLGPVIDPSETIRAAHAANIPGLVTGSDYTPLLTDPAVAAVAIATPARTHHAIAKAFLLAGKDVFVEKPMTLTVEDAEDLHRTALDHGRILMTGHLLLYHPAIRVIKEALAAGRIGTVFTLHQERAKLGRVRDKEDVLWSLGVHDIAVLLHLVGVAPERVTSFTHTGLQPHIADDVYLHLDFPGGVKATLHNSWLWPADSRVLRVIGNTGIIEYLEKEQKVLLHHKTVDASLQHHDRGTEVLFEETSTEPLRLELQHFIDCVRDRSTPVSDGQNGIDVIRALAQASP